MCSKSLQSYAVRKNSPVTFFRIREVAQQIVCRPAAIGCHGSCQDRLGGIEAFGGADVAKFP